MNAAVLGGLVEQWVWRCQKIATQYQLRQPMDLQGEIEKLVGQALVQARLMQESGPVFLAKVESRLGITAQIAALPARLAPPREGDAAGNAAARVRGCLRPCGAAPQLGGVAGRAKKATACGPIPKFVSTRGTFGDELRNPRTTSNL
jgi:hypothetical protein